MRIIRFESEGNARYGRLLDDGTAVACDGNPFDGLKDTSRQIDTKQLRLLPPVPTGKIIGVGLNYRAHAKEHRQTLPAEPLLFHKPISALVGNGAPIALRYSEKHNDEEAELVIVICRRARRISLHDAAAHILGYTAGNDVTDRDTQVEDRNWTARSKGFDTYAPVGPCVATDIDPRDLAISARINGKQVQNSSTNDLVFGAFELVSFISHVCTLEPGDLIFTGTPSGVSRIQPGDKVEVEIAGIGVLSNPVIDAASA